MRDKYTRVRVLSPRARGTHDYFELSTPPTSFSRADSPRSHEQFTLCLRAGVACRCEALRFRHRLIGCQVLSESAQAQHVPHALRRVRSARVVGCALWQVRAAGALVGTAKRGRSGGGGAPAMPRPAPLQRGNTGRCWAAFGLPQGRMHSWQRPRRRPRLLAAVAERHLLSPCRLWCCG